MKREIVPVLLALALGASACGGTGSEGQEAVGQTTPDREHICDALSDPEALREGACVERGVRYVVVDGRSPLELRSLTATIRNVSVAPDLPKRLRRANGVFIVLTLVVHNREDVARRFAPGQTFLSIGEQQYPESVRVERTHKPSLAHPSRERIAPDEYVTGDVVFEIPPEEVPRVETDGRLFVVNFGARSPLEGGQPRELGQFRLFQ